MVNTMQISKVTLLIACLLLTLHSFTVWGTPEGAFVNADAGFLLRSDKASTFLDCSTRVVIAPNPDEEEMPPETKRELMEHAREYAEEETPNEWS